MLFITLLCNSRLKFYKMLSQKNILRTKHYLSYTLWANSSTTPIFIDHYLTCSRQLSFWELQSLLFTPGKAVKYSLVKNQYDQERAADEHIEFIPTFHHLIQSLKYFLKSSEYNLFTPLHLHQQFKSVFNMFYSVQLKNRTCGL